MASYASRNPLLYPVEPSPLPADDAGHCVVIPVYDENDALPETLASLKVALTQAPEPVAIVLVINEPQDAPGQAHQANIELLAALRSGKNDFTGNLQIGRELYWIDLVTHPPIDAWRNVGNARKVGMDLAALNGSAEIARKERIIFSLDADSPVSEGYISATLEHFAKQKNDAGCVMNFAHRFSDDPELAHAGMRYELWLRDYCRKCRDAGSFYGFWSIGSAFAVRADRYVACGGMRRRAGGEDFYFLQALRKVGPIGLARNSFVYPAGRLSERVPFGTGPALRRQLEDEPLLFSNPAGFAHLKHFFDAARGSSGHEHDLLDLSALWSAADVPLQNFLGEMNFSAVWEKIVRNTPRSRRAQEQALQTYCDGFFILKYIHYLEETDPENYGRIAGPLDRDLAMDLEIMRQSDQTAIFR